MEDQDQEKDDIQLYHEHSILRGTENEAAQSNTLSSQSHGPQQGSIPVQPESEENCLNAHSVLVTINSIRRRLRLQHHQTDHYDVSPAPAEGAAVAHTNLPPPCVSGSSVLLNSSSSINGFMSIVEPQMELIHKDCGRAKTEPAPAAVLGVCYPPVHHIIDIDPPLLSQHGLITYGALMEQPTAPLVKFSHHTT